ncbi:MAG: peptide chain release factor-like protein [Deltaproteobacteria bacterium]|nr:peptide chain release factor-like protein [Deltaproteobacteria bacterium]
MPVSPQKKERLKEKMERLQIFEKDLEENFIRASGSGGQKVNKTSSCVWLKHIPTGLEIKCQQTRSQADNRYFARALLCEKFQEQWLQEKSEKQKQIEKIRRQKRKKSKRAKEKMLESKRKQSLKKDLRKKPTFDD